MFLQSNNEMSSPEISVLMLTHNREYLVSRMIEGILNQSFTDFEFLIFDTASTDRSGEICEEYAKRDKRIKVWHIDNNSIGSSRNKAVKHAKGRYITFVDDDDMVEKDFLEFLHNLIVDNDADISICGACRNTNGNIEPHGMWNDKCVWTPQQSLEEMLLRRRNFQRMPTKLIKRELYQSIPFKEDCKYEDIWVCYRFMASAKKVVAYGIPKYVFYRHSGNNSSFVLTDEWNSERIDEYLKAYRERSIYISARFPELNNLCRYSEWSLWMSLCEKISKRRLKSCHKYYEYMLSNLKKDRLDLEKSPWLNEFDIKRTQTLLL